MHKNKASCTHIRSVAHWTFFYLSKLLRVSLIFLFLKSIFFFSSLLYIQFFLLPHEFYYILKFFFGYIREQQRDDDDAKNTFPFVKLALNSLYFFSPLLTVHAVPLKKRDSTEEFYADKQQQKLN